MPALSRDRVIWNRLALPLAYWVKIEWTISASCGFTTSAAGDRGDFFTYSYP
jgi:hypothetical protein